MGIAILSDVTRKEAIMNSDEKRKHPRLALQFELICHRPGQTGSLHAGKTVNISTGGVLFELAGAELKSEDIINLEFSIPPDQGMLDYGGTLKSLARVIDVRPHPSRALVAAQFFQPPRFVV